MRVQNGSRKHFVENTRCALHLHSIEPCAQGMVVRPDTNIHTRIFYTFLSQKESGSKK